MFDARAKTLPYYLVNWTVRVRVMWWTGGKVFLHERFLFGWRFAFGICIGSNCTTFGVIGAAADSVSQFRYGGFKIVVDRNCICGCKHLPYIRYEPFSHAIEWSHTHGTDFPTRRRGIFGACNIKTFINMCLCVCLHAVGREVPTFCEDKLIEFRLPTSVSESISLQTIQVGGSGEWHCQVCTAYFTTFIYI